uniref:C2 domain-containing protein n=1 Tax=Panagrolaimus sp. JU765 TaxID=591449 RepID=A0AC34RJE9_9BILA
MDWMLRGTSFSAEDEELQRDKAAKVLLTIYARDLKDVNVDGDQDPYCIVSVTDVGMSRTRHWEEIGRTEAITNTLNPDWATKICMFYNFEEQQRLQFEVFLKGPYKQRIGAASMLLHEIMGAKYNRLTKDLVEEGKHEGTITVTAEYLGEGRQDSVYFTCSASNLDKKDFLGKCDPFLKVLRINEDDTLQLAYRTRYHEQNLNPKWKPFEILLSQLCYGDMNREFIIECYDWDQDGQHDFIGNCRTTVNRLINKLDVDLPLINEKKAKKSKKYANSGVLHFDKVHLWHDYTFLDFVSGGTELDFTVAIDFTKSNLPMDDQSSLHHIDGENVNQYEIAIMAVAEICQHYNRSKCFHAYGFGAKIPPDQKTHYNFPLNVVTNNARCYGITGLLEAYLIAQSKVELSGPTDFVPCIRLAAKRAASLPEDGSKYCVLLILTDGVIADMEETKAEIIRASSLPLSIIIVGIGYDSFEEMKILDSDHQMLSQNGKFAKRDIVQFVQMRKYLPPHRALTEEDTLNAKTQLAKEVLYEVPAQLTSYMKSKGIYPRPPTSPFIDEIISRRGSIAQQESPRTPRRVLPTTPEEQEFNFTNLRIS